MFIDKSTQMCYNNIIEERGKHPELKTERTCFYDKIF